MKTKLGERVNDWVRYEHGEWKRDGRFIRIRSDGPEIILPDGVTIKLYTLKVVYHASKAVGEAEVVGWEPIEISSIPHDEGIAELEDAYDKLQTAALDVQRRFRDAHAFIETCDARIAELETELAALNQRHRTGDVYDIDTLEKTQAVVNGLIEQLEQERERAKRNREIYEAECESYKRAIAQLVKAEAALADIACFDTPYIMDHHRYEGDGHRARDYFTSQYGPDECDKREALAKAKYANE